MPLPTPNDRTTRKKKKNTLNNRTQNRLISTWGTNQNAFKTFATREFETHWHCHSGQRHHTARQWVRWSDMPALEVGMSSSEVLKVVGSGCRSGYMQTEKEAKITHVKVTTAPGPVLHWSTRRR
jgi:hypothetical protein